TSPPASRATSTSEESWSEAIRKKISDFPWGTYCFTGVKKEEMGHSKVVTRRLVQLEPVATRSLKSKAAAKVSKATTHCDHSMAGVRASQMREMMPLVPQACRMSWTASPS